MRAIILLSALSLAAALAAAPRPASACGGCFAPPDQITSVEAHRMVISLSTGRTTLWDQIRYTGDPADFVWVLPVPDPAATIDVAAPEFFEDLEAATAPVVVPLSPPPQRFCPGDGSGGIGCGGGADFASSDSPDAGGVTIFDEDTVGPYETVTIGSESPAALVDWLVAHSYNVPDATRPIIDYYVGQGSAFIALRLSPGEGVSAMQPVRVRYPGYMASFPLKMVTVGAYGVIELSLWIVADQRMEAANYGTVEIHGSDLSWDWNTNRSNYTDVFDQVIDRAGGRAWVVESFGRMDDIGWRTASLADVDVASAVGFPLVTRLRTRMLVDHLIEDLELRPAASAEWVSNRLVAEHDLNYPPPIECDDDGCMVGLGRREKGAAAGLVLFVLGMAVVRWRRRRTT